MAYVVTMKPTIKTSTHIKPITTKKIFTSAAIPTNKKSNIYSTLNIIHKYFHKTTLKNNKYNSKTTTLIKKIKQATTNKMNKLFLMKRNKLKKN